MISADCFKTYRTKLGFSNVQDVKKFFGAKDLFPSIDSEYLTKLNKRLYEIICKINEAISDNSKINDLKNFEKEFITDSYDIIMEHKILPRLNNLGRRPEEVYYSWMRGFVMMNFFRNALGHMFNVNPEELEAIGEDDLKNIDTFKKAPTADLEVPMDGKRVRLEIQSGFMGINDIKQHKVLEAKRIFREKSVQTLCIHFDIFNGQTAIVPIDSIEDNDINWITRQQMEGQTVFEINQNYFVWKLTEDPLNIKQYLAQIK
jgi:hypothetical protein